MEKITLKFTGTSALLMHSERGANPLDAKTQQLKKLTSARKKTDETHLEIARVEWELALYHDEKLGPYMPTQNLRAALVEGAKANKLGTAVKKATLIMSDREALAYKGPRDIDGLWSANKYVDCRSVVVGQARTMRTRPVFPEWRVQFELLFDPSVLQRDHLIEAAQIAGRLIGVGDFRPACGGHFGRFDVEVLS